MISITLPLPPSLNTRLAVNKQGKMAQSALARDYKTEVGWLCRAKNIEPFPDGSKIEVVMSIHLPTHDADIDNYAKIAIDGLKGHVWADDKWIYALHLFKTVNDLDPHIELTARVIEGE